MLSVDHSYGLVLLSRVAQTRGKYNAYVAMDRSCESVLLPRVAQTHAKCNAYVEYGPFLWVGVVIQSRSDAYKIRCIC